MKKLGGQCVYPVGNQGEFGPEYGLTYRQWMAGQIAGDVIGDAGAAIGKVRKLAGETVLVTDEREQDFHSAIGRTIWLLTDAILEAEETRESKHP